MLWFDCDMEDMGNVGVSCLGRVLEGGQILPIEMPFHADDTCTPHIFTADCTCT